MIVMKWGGICCIGRVCKCLSVVDGQFSSTKRGLDSILIRNGIPFRSNPPDFVTAAVGDVVTWDIRSLSYPQAMLLAGECLNLSKVSGDETCWLDKVRGMIRAHCLRCHPVEYFWTLIGGNGVLASFVDLPQEEEFFDVDSDDEEVDFGEDE